MHWREQLAEQHEIQRPEGRRERRRHDDDQDRGQHLQGGGPVVARRPAVVRRCYAIEATRLQE